MVRIVPALRQIYMSLPGLGLAPGLLEACKWGPFWLGP